MSIRDQIDNLRDAIAYAVRVAPLPRCPHGYSLRDYAGELLEPSCECRLREKFIDPDFRREPKTATFCARCQKDLPAVEREVYLRDGGVVAVRPEDVNLGQMKNDLGWLPIGGDCAKKIGVEWTRSKPSDEDK